MVDVMRKLLAAVLGFFRKLFSPRKKAKTPFKFRPTFTSYEGPDKREHVAAHRRGKLPRPRKPLNF